MENQSEPFDLSLTSFEVADRIGGLVEVRSERKNEYRMTIKEDFREEDILENSYGISVRHRLNGEDNFIASENLRKWPAELNRFVEKIRRKTGSESTSIPDVSTQSIQGRVKIGNIDFNTLMEEIKPIAIDLMKTAVSNLKNEFHLQWDVIISSITKTFTSSQGTHIFQKIPTALFTFHFTQKKSPFNSISMMIGGINKQNLSWEKLTKSLNTLITEAKGLQNARRINIAETDIVFSHDTAWTLTHEFVGHAVERSLEYSSYLQGKEGTKVAPSIISVVDDKSISAIGSYGFDDEGNKAGGTVIIEEGILTSFLYDNKTAAIDGVNSTGNARALSVNLPPIVRQSNLFVEPGDYSDGELFEEIKEGIYFGPAEYAFSEPARGRVTIKPQYLQKIQDGELKEMYLSIPVTWNFHEIFPKITAIGKSLMNRPTFCTKEDGKIGVGMISPMFAANNVRVRT